MIIRNRHLSCGATTLAALSVLSLLAFATSSCTSPPMLCDVPSAPYATQYFPKDAASDCLSLPGEIVGMKAYNPPSENGENLDATKTTLAVQPSSTGELSDAAAAAGTSDPDKTHTVYSLGDYTNKPDADDICSAGALSSAEVHAPKTEYTDADGNAAVLPETRLMYEWQSLRVYTTFRVPGNAATGVVTITREVTDPDTGVKDSCTTTYVAAALSPAVGCEAVDADGNGTGKPNDAACCAEPDLTKDRPYGSGINPDFKVICDPALLLCVLDWRPGEDFPPLGHNPACGSSAN